MLPQPPSMAKSLLRRALPRDVRDTILVDLDEVFQRRANADGATAARRWYWRETMSFTWRFMRERMSMRRPLQLAMVSQCRAGVSASRTPLNIGDRLVFLPSVKQLTRPSC